MPKPKRPIPPITAEPPITDAEEAEIQRQIAADPDDQEWTEEDFKNAKSFAEMFPDLAASIRRARGRPRLAAPKKLVSLRLDPDVLEKFQRTGKGWRQRINDALKRAKV
jgi:uncharacterized protein (DUF4415 family)